MRRQPLICIVALLCLGSALAANDPGHDSLYIEQSGDSNLTGSLNISNELKVANLIYSSYLDILGNGSQPSSSFTQIYAQTGGNELVLNAPTRLYLAKDSGSMVHIGTAAVDLNVSQNLYLANNLIIAGTTRISATGVATLAASSTVDGSAICTAANGLCNGASSAGGWTNTSTTTATDLLVDINNGLNVSGDVNVSGVLRIGGNTILNSTGGGAFQAGSTVDGSAICTAANGLCNQTAGSYTEWLIASSDTGGTSSVANGTTVTIDSGTGIQATRVGTTVTITNLGDTNGADDLTTSTAWGGDLGGTGSSPIVNDDSHAHDAANITSGNLAVARLPTGGAWSLSSDLNIDSNKLVVDNDNNRVGIMDPSPTGTLDVTGNIAISDIEVISSGRVGTFADGTTVDSSAVCTPANGLCNQSSADEATVEGFIYDSGNALAAQWTVTSDGTYDINFDTNSFVVDADLDRVGIGVAAPSKRLEVSDGSTGFTFDPSPSDSLIMNTTGGANMTITSSGGSVIIKLS